MPNIYKHYRWGVGHDDGAMLLISILDRQLYVSTGKRAMKLLSDDQIDIIIEEIKPYMQKKDYDQGVKLAIFRMGEVFSSEVLMRSTNYGFIILCVLLIITVLYILYQLKQSEPESIEERFRHPYASDPTFNTKAMLWRAISERGSFSSGVGSDWGGRIGGRGRGGSW